MIKSIKTKELIRLAESWEGWANTRLKEHEIEKNWNNYYSAAGLLTAAEDLKNLIKLGYYETE
jgi:hypothetical protein